jgi:hypothetical protein
MEHEQTGFGPEKQPSDDPTDEERSAGVEGDPGLPPEGEDPMDGAAPSG